MIPFPSRSECRQELYHAALDSGMVEQTLISVSRTRLASRPTPATESTGNILRAMLVTVDARHEVQLTSVPGQRTESGASEL